MHDRSAEPEQCQYQVSNVQGMYKVYKLKVRLGKPRLKYPTGLVQALDYATRKSQDELFDDSRTELDSHANMPVVGRNALIIEDQGVKVDVIPFSPDYPALEAKLVDAVVQYECPYNQEIYMLIIRNAIYVPSIEVNLIPPFIMREARIIVNDVTKIQTHDPSSEDHAIIFQETGFRIPLKLNGIFSYFPTMKPMMVDFESSDNIYVLTPNNWNPNSETYSENEDRMLDWEGNVVPFRTRKRLLLSDIPENAMINSVLSLGKEENEFIDNLIDIDEVHHPDFIPWEADEVN